MRGRKQGVSLFLVGQVFPDHKKRIPEWGDGNPQLDYEDTEHGILDKKRIPEWGDGNNYQITWNAGIFPQIKKESPNEGTETL